MAFLYVISYKTIMIAKCTEPFIRKNIYKSEFAQLIPSALTNPEFAQLILSTVHQP